MKIKIIPAVLLAAALCAAFAQSTPTRWSYFPMNSNKASGLQFYFDGRVGSTATVTVEADRDGKPISITKEISTDASDGGSFLPIDIGNLDKFHVRRIQIDTGKRESKVDDPRAGKYYEF